MAYGLIAQAAHRGWWHSYSDALPGWFEAFVGLEDGAKSLLIYDNQLVPGLMRWCLTTCGRPRCRRSGRRPSSARPPAA